MMDRAKDVTDQVVTQIEQANRRRTAPLILELDLTEPLVEGVPQDPLSALRARRQTSLRMVLDGLHRAGRDPRVRALVAKVGGSRPALPAVQAQELREAVEEFRHHGKLTVAWAETFGEAGGGSAPYYLATAFEEVWLQPSGDVGLTGVAGEVPFLRGALDRIGITPQIAQRHEYKNAANIFTEREFTEAHREATECLVDSVMVQLVAAIATDRNMSRTEVGALFDRAPVFATEALEAGLVDHLGYRDEIYASVRERVGTDAFLMYVGRYGRSKLTERIARPRSDKLGLIHVTGPIHLGRSGMRPGGQNAGSDTVVAALRAATEARGVKAIVLRVASPGGSYVASDTIWRQVALTRQAGKPVVVSMGNVAASGGYYVSMGADTIVAEPATITGSIGVVSGKPVVDRLLERLSIGHEAVAGARHSLMFSPFQKFSEDEWERLNIWLDRVYDDFVGKVADSRGLRLDRVRDIARGRVWTGADARERGLVDELGGLRTAVDIAKERAGIPSSVDTALDLYPRTPLMARLRPAQSSEDLAAATARIRLDAWGTFADLATSLGLPAHGPLTLG